MRGQRMYRQANKQVNGITPANAGTTMTQNGGFNNSTDHPRGCGDNSIGALQKRAADGSPPRMRGQPNLYSIQIVSQRITPADAGTTKCAVQRVVYIKDHPRGCGDNPIPEFLEC